MHIYSNNCWCAIMFQTNIGARNIRALELKCSNLNRGCQWTGELRVLETHLQSCDYALIPCTNECKHNCQMVKILKKNLQNHLANKCLRRQYQCPNCWEMGEYEERTTSHLETCPKVKVQCPNVKCQDTIFRCEVSTHRLTCDYEPVSCKYAEVGCEEEPLRKNLRKHEENANLHLQITTEKVLELNKLFKYTVISPFNFKLTNFQTHQYNEDMFYSSPFYTSPTGYKMCVSVIANGDEGTHVSAFIHLMKGDNDNFLTWPFTGEFIIEILNQLENKYHHRVSAIIPADESTGKRVVDGERAKNAKGWSQFISHADLDYQPDKNCQYLKDDMLVFRVSVSPNTEHSRPWLM